MESRRIILELRVLTSRMTEREIERDIDRLVMNLRDVESGETTVKEATIKEVV